MHYRGTLYSWSTSDFNSVLSDTMNAYFLTWWRSHEMYKIMWGLETSCDYYATQLEVVFELVSGYFCILIKEHLIKIHDIIYPTGINPIYKDLSMERVLLTKVHTCTCSRLTKILHSLYFYPCSKFTPLVGSGRYVHKPHLCLYITIWKPDLVIRLF